MFFLTLLQTDLLVEDKQIGETASVSTARLISNNLWNIYSELYLGRLTLKLVSEHTENILMASISLGS